MIETGQRNVNFDRLIALGFAPVVAHQRAGELSETQLKDIGRLVGGGFCPAAAFDLAVYGWAGT